MIREKQDGLEAEFTVTKVEKVLERGTQKVHHHSIIITFGSEPSDKRHSNAACESLVDFGLVLKLGMLGFHGFEFYTDLLSGDDVDPKVDVT